jgi:hypothetical protein
MYKFTIPQSYGISASQYVISVQKKELHNVITYALHRMFHSSAYRNAIHTHIPLSVNGALKTHQWGVTLHTHHTQKAYPTNEIIGTAFYFSTIV